MGKFLQSSTKNENKTLSTQTFKDLRGDLEGLTRDIVKTPFQEFSGNRVAGLSGNEQLAAQKAREMASGNPLMSLASSLAMENPGGFNELDLQKFINPYEQFVINNSKERLQEDYEKQLVGARGNAAASGSFGNSRLGLVEGSLGSEFLKSSKELQYGGLRDAFDRAMSNNLAFNRDRREGINLLSDLSGRNQQYDANALNLLRETGRDERGVEQAGLDFNFQQYLDRINDPTKRLQAGLGSLGGLHQTYDTMQKTTQSQSPMSAVMGLAGIAASVATGNPMGALSGLSNRASGPPTALTPQSAFRPKAGYMYNPGSQTGWGNSGMPALYAEGGLIEGFAEGGKVKRKDLKRKYAGIDNLIKMISDAESSYGDTPYDVSYGGEKYSKISGGKKLSEATIQELIDNAEALYEASGRKSTAAGIGQFMLGRENDSRGYRKKFLNDLQYLGIPLTEVFSPEVQQQLLVKRLEDRGLEKFLRNRKMTSVFADSIAKEWAGLPYSTGRTFYGDGINKSNIPRKRVLEDLENFRKLNTTDEMDKRDAINNLFDNILKGVDYAQEKGSDAKDLFAEHVKELQLAQNSEKGRNPLAALSEEELAEPYSMLSSGVVQGDGWSDNPFDLLAEMNRAKNPSSELLNERYVHPGTDPDEKTMAGLEELLNTGNPLDFGAKPSVMANNTMQNVKEKEHERNLREYSMLNQVLMKGQPTQKDKIAIYSRLRKLEKSIITKNPRKAPIEDFSNESMDLAARDRNSESLGEAMYFDAPNTPSTTMGNEYYDLTPRFKSEETSVMGNQLYNLNRPQKYAEGGKIDIRDLVRQNAIPEANPRPEKVWPQSILMRQTPRNINFLAEFMNGISETASPQQEDTTADAPRDSGATNILAGIANSSPAPTAGRVPSSGYKKTVDMSIENLLKMAGVKPQEEEKPDTIFGLPYDKDLMRFGIAALSSGTGKSGAQALGEAANAIFEGRERDKKSKLEREMRPLGELSSRLGILNQAGALQTQQANIRNLDPDTQLATLERRLNLQGESAMKLARLRAELKTKSNKEQVDLLKALMASGDPQAVAMAKKLAGIEDTAVDPEAGDEDL